MGFPRPRAHPPDCRALPHTRVLFEVRAVPALREPQAVMAAPAASSPEDERLARAGPRDVTLYTRPGCHLCEEAKAAMAPLLKEFAATMREVNVDKDSVLRERYGNDVPVV